MQNMCLSCEVRSTKGRNLLCHSCEVEERNKEVDQIDLQDSREFKLDMRRILQDIPAARMRR